MLGIDASGPLHPGDRVTLSGSGLPPGSSVQFELHSAPVALGSATVTAGGNLSYAATIPAAAEAGRHHVVGILTPPGGVPSTAEAPIQVASTAGAVPAEGGSPGASGPEGSSATGREGTAGSAGGLATSAGQNMPRSEPGAPSVLTGVVPTAVDVIASPGSIAVAGGLALAILILVALPTEILNSALASSTGRFGRRVARLEDATTRATEWLSSRFHGTALPAVLLVIVTAIVFGFTDTHFGFDITSLRLVLSLGIALFVVTWVASALSSLVMRRRWRVESSIVLQPIALIFAVLGVVLARLLDFSPGFLIGLVIGLEVGHQINAGQRARAVVVQFAIVAGLSVAAWLGYSIAVGLQGVAGSTFLSALVQDTLVAIVAEGLTAIMVAMLPIGFLDGRELFSHSKWLWAVMFLVIGTLFALLVLPNELNGQQVGDLGVWLLVLIGYAVVALVAWLILRKRNSADDENEPAQLHDALR